MHDTPRARPRNQIFPDGLRVDVFMRKQPSLLIDFRNAWSAILIFA